MRRKYCCNKAGLDKVGLTTHAYKNVNMSNLNENDIIYLTSEGCHYVNYHANKTNLTDFTGYVITPKLNPDLDTPSFEEQTNIHGAFCGPCLVTACLENIACKHVLREVLQVGVESVAWCSEHREECVQYVKEAIKRLAGNGKKLSDEMRKLHPNLLGDKKNQPHLPSHPGH